MATFLGSPASSLVLCRDAQNGGLEKFGPACVLHVGHWRWHFQMLCNLRKLAFHCFQRSVSETCDCVRGWLKSKNTRSKTCCQKRQPSLSRLSKWFSSPSSCSSFSRLHHPPVSMLRKLGTRPSRSTSRTQKPQSRCPNLEKPQHRPNLEKPQHRPNLEKAQNRCPNLEKPQHRRCPNLEKAQNLEKLQNRCPNLEKPQNRCPNLERNATNTQRLRSSARTEKG